MKIKKVKTEEEKELREICDIAFYNYDRIRRIFPPVSFSEYEIVRIIFETARDIYNDFMLKEYGSKQMGILVKVPAVFQPHVQKEIDKGFSFVKDKQQVFNEICACDDPNEKFENLQRELHLLDNHLSQVAIYCASCHIPFAWRKDYEAAQELQEQMIGILKELRANRS